MDDHQAFAESLRSLLSADERIEVVGWAENGEEAVRMAQSLRPDLIVMDMDMPVMNGVEATRVLSKSALVLLLTGSDSASDIALARRAGASAYIRKGNDSDDVIASVLLLGSQLCA